MNDYELDPSARETPTRFGTDPAGRRVVLKPLADDCLQGVNIHPSIRERLQRMRELPVAQVADLLGVERIEGRVMLVWAWLFGTPLAEWAAETDADEPTRRRALKEVRLIVEALHSAGIVHGSVHAQNVIVDYLGVVRLTHISPYLYDDPKYDDAGLLSVAETLRLPADLPTPAQRRDAEEAKPIKSRAATLAVVVAVLGVVLAGAVWWLVRDA